MVGMLMRDENGGKVFRRAANGGKPLADLARRKTGVNQHAGTFGFYVGAITGRTAAENSESNGHKCTLAALNCAGNFFR